VRDSGNGIPEERLETLFTVFRHHIAQLAEKKEHDASSGVGIGLSNSKILAEGIGGTISLKSELDKFTEVSFTVEAAPTEVRKDPLLQAPAKVAKHESKKKVSKHLVCS